VDRSASPLVCPSDPGRGAIDPTTYADTKGAEWLLWKTEGGGGSEIWSQRLDGGRLGLVGAASQLIHADQRWEGSVVEGPTLARIGDRLVLLYSGNDWNTARYAIGFATCASPDGPCRKPVDHPVVSSSGPMAGPGGETVFTDATGALMSAFHAWRPDAIGYPKSRLLFLRHLGLDRSGVPTFS
jgi:beta-xylosidase